MVEGTSENEGRVEIFHKDRWGTICDDGWDLNDANVICRMLNYSGALAAPIISAYDVGSGQIWLDEVNCVGNESSIYDCPHGGWGNHDCSHLEDAGVICQTNESALPSYGMRQHFYSSNTIVVSYNVIKLKKCFSLRVSRCYSDKFPFNSTDFHARTLAKIH